MRLNTNLSDAVAFRLNEARQRIRNTSVQPNAPYFQMLLYALTLVEVERGTLKTFAIDDKLRLFIDPEFLETISVEETAAVLIHEIGHIYQKHKRRADRMIAELGARAIEITDEQGNTAQGTLTEDSSEYLYRRLWNVAADAELNDDLRRAGWKLPKFKPPAEPGKPAKEEDCVYPEQFDMAEGLLAEEYFNRLLADPTKVKIDPGCGSGSGGVRLEVEGPGGGGELKDQDGKPIPGQSEAQVIGKVKSVAQAVQAQEMSKPGTVPAGFVRQAEEILGPSEVDWRSRLRFAVRQATVFGPGVGERTYLKVNRRQAGLGFGVGKPVLAGQRRPKPDVWVSVDASGSVSEKGLGYALREVDGVLRTVGEVRISSWDGVAYPPKRVRGVAQAAKAIHGGGGTCIDVAFQQMIDAKISPNVAIVITDGEVIFEDPEILGRLRAKVVVVVVGHERSAQELQKIAGWEVVHIEER